MPRSGLLTLIVLALSGAVRPEEASAQAVMLQIKPQAGDTLLIRLDQRVEMTGTVRVGDAESTTSESSVLTVTSRLVIESTDGRTATAVATIDSVRLTSPASSAIGALFAWAPSMEGRQYRFNVATDGSTSMEGSDPGGRSDPAGALLSHLPATLPKRAISPGASWPSVVYVPLTGSLGGTGSSTLRATFRFDSLADAGSLAFVSMTGRLSRSPSGTGPAGGGARGETGSVVESSGTVTGSFLVDRRRGWITDARTTVTVHSLVVPAASDKPPMRVRMVISQWVRVM